MKNFLNSGLFVLLVCVAFLVGVIACLFAGAAYQKSLMYDRVISGRIVYVSEYREAAYEVIVRTGPAETFDFALSRQQAFGFIDLSVGRCADLSVYDFKDPNRTFFLDYVRAVITNVRECTPEDPQ